MDSSKYRCRELLRYLWVESLCIAGSGIKEFQHLLKRLDITLYVSEVLTSQANAKYHGCIATRILVG
jgi:hypothetical protein